MTSDWLPVWQQTDTGLIVQVDQQRDRLPDPICDWLIGPGGVGLLGDPAHDLLRMDSRLRHMIAQLSEEIATTERRTHATPSEGVPPNTIRRRRRRRAGRELQASLDARVELVDSRERARTLLEILRTFVVELDVQHGLLREAADGWSRQSNPPPGVVVFDDEDTFLETDPRRGTASEWGGSTLAGIEQFGLTWRRDGDEAVDDPATSTPNDEPQRAGPWQLGYIVRTGEAYAIRRCSHLPRQVWLLGRGFDAPRVLGEILRPIMPRISEPNSVILAAGAVLAAQTSLRPTTPLGPSEPRSGNTDLKWTHVHVPDEAD